jgi:hypothetical protein
MFVALGAVDGQSAPYGLFAPTGVGMSPRTAGFGNRDCFKLNGKIGLCRAGRIVVALFAPQSNRMVIFGIRSPREVTLMRIVG